MKRFILLSMLVCVSAHASPIQTIDAVAAILGEGANQPYKAKLGIACAIRNRGSLQGVYGINNLRAQQCDPKTRRDALRAWQESATHDITGGCKFFGCPGDRAYFHRLHFRPVLHAGAITFYKP